MKKKQILKIRAEQGFSLAEVLAAVIIGSMVVVAVLGIYNRAESSVSAIRDKLEENRKPREVLQRITEDIDSVTGQGTGTAVKLQTKTNSDGYTTGRLEMVRGYYNDDGEKQLLEKIVWQSSYDIESDTEGLVLYRSHTGPASKDPLFEQWRAEWEENFSFIPMCEGVTYFSVQAVQGDNVVDEWDEDSPPNGVKVTISFTEPQETITGDLEVPESERASRTIAMDKTREITFDIFKEESENEQEDDQ